MVGNKYRNTEAFLDEISVAHKAIDQVMAEAAELVTNVRTLHQMVIEKVTSTPDVALRRRLQGAISVRELGRDRVPSVGASPTLCPARVRTRVAPAPSPQHQHPAPAPSRAHPQLAAARSSRRAALLDGRGIGTWSGSTSIGGISTKPSSSCWISQ